MRYAGLGQLHGAEEVDLHAAAPAVQVCLRDGFEIAGVIGAVEQHIDAAKGFHGGAGECLALVLVGDIRHYFQGAGAEAEGLDLSLGGIQLGRGAGRQHHARGALAGSQGGQLLAQTRTNPGNNHDLVFQQHDRHSSVLIVGRQWSSILAAGGCGRNAGAEVAGTGAADRTGNGARPALARNRGYQA